MSRISNEEHLRRLIALAAYLEPRPDTPLTTLAEHFGVTKERIVQDLETLEDCALPGEDAWMRVELDDDGVVTLEGAEFLGRTGGIARPEAMRLVAAGRLVANLPGADTDGLVQRATEKVAAALDEAVVDIHVGESGVDEALVLTVRNAVAQHKVLRIVYLTGGRGDAAEREIEPLRFTLVNDHWYVRAWCRTREGMRTFRLDRIGECNPTGETFTDRSDDGEIGYLRGEGDYEATLHVGPGGRWIAQHYPVESAEVADDGSMRIVMTSASQEILVGVVLRLGVDVIGVEPEWLRAEVAEAVRRIAARSPSAS